MTRRPFWQKNERDDGGLAEEEFCDFDFGVISAVLSSSRGYDEDIVHRGQILRGVSEQNTVRK
jgi:hypothetical protein